MFSTSEQVHEEIKQAAQARKLREIYDPFQIQRLASLESKRITEHSRIRISVWNSLTPAPIIHFHYRTLSQNGSVEDNVEVITPTTDRIVTEATIRLSDGFLLSCFFISEDETVRRGHTYVRAHLHNSKLDQHAEMLTQGYVTSQVARFWPGGINEASTDGPGLIRLITGTDPAAGAEISETIPTNARWKIKFLRVALVTDATVATRAVHLQHDDGTTVYWNSTPQATQAATLTQNYNYVEGGPRVAVGALNTDDFLALLDLMLQGFRITTVTALLQAGDNFGAPVIVVEEWIEE